MVDEPVVSNKTVVNTQNTVKQFPVSEKVSEIDLNTAANIGAPLKPNVYQFSSEAKSGRFDTNKLPPLSEEVADSFERNGIKYKKIVLDVDLEDELLEIPSARKLRENAEKTKTNAKETVAETEPEEDYYPQVSLRFNAALFDLLICAFLSLILLSPFMLLNGRFFSVEGFFAFLATCAIVSFIYLTTTIGFLGRSFGMKIFSLEIYDIEEDNYPTLHQAAVSSSVYLLSIALGGIGFLTMLLNSEKRAVHDLISRTVIIKE